MSKVINFLSVELTKKRNALQILLCGVTAILLTACASIPDTKSVQLTEDLSFKLTAPPINKIDTFDSHLVEINSKENNHQFIAQVEYRDNEIAMAAISPQGLPLFDFIWFSHKSSEINQYVPLPDLDIGFIDNDPLANDK